MSTEITQDTSSASGVSAESTSANAETTTTPAIEAQANAAADPAVDAKSIGDKLADIKAGKSASAPVVPAAATPAYTPNFKYRAAMQDKEIDPFWQGLIKDAESEKKVKDIFTKVEAFDYIKSKHESVEQSYNSMKADYDSQNQLVSKVTQAARNKDYDSVFRNIGMNDEDVIRWAAKKVDYLQMMNGLPPEQRAAIEGQQKAALQNQEYQDQLNYMQSQVETQAQQARELQLEMIMTRPEVTHAATFWDGKMGQVGAFRDLVIEEGQKAFAFEQLDLSAEQAVSRVLAKFGKFIDAQGNVASQAAPVAHEQVAQQGIVASQKPIIPTINGTAKTPIKKQFRSLDDIKKYNQERADASS